jgi:hypothetical protein
LRPGFRGLPGGRGVAERHFFSARYERGLGKHLSCVPPGRVRLIECTRGTSVTSVVSPTDKLRDATALLPSRRDRLQAGAALAHDHPLAASALFVASLHNEARAGVGVAVQVVR